MRAFTALTALAIAITPVLAQKGTLGFCLGTKKPDGTCKYQADYEADFDAIQSASGSTVVRGYAASDCNCAQYILPAAKSKGFKVVLGVWPDTDDSFNADKTALTTYVPQYMDQVYAVTVGSETMYRKNFTASQLLDKINNVKQALPGVRMGTADTWTVFADGTADAIIQGGVDLILANAFSFWQGENVGAGAVSSYFDDIQQALGHIQSLTGSLDKIEFWNGETGWPTDGGSNYEASQAGTANAATFFSQGVCGILDWGINVFYFEAFDEPWKPASIGLDGNPANEVHWGAMNADRSSKPNFSLKC